MVWGVAQGGLRGGDTDEVLRGFVDQTGVTFPIVRDVSGYGLFRRSTQAPMVSPFPIDVLIDADGRLVSLRGEYDPDALLGEVRRLLGLE